MECRSLVVFAVLAVAMTLVNLTEASKCTKCPPGYTFHPPSGKCFKLHRMPKGQPVGWSNYRRACQSLPGDEWKRSTADLASIHGEPAQRIAMDLAKTLGGEASVWIGLRQVGAAWKWTDDSKKGAEFWEQGMPDGKPMQDCARLNLKNQGRWDDIECGNQAIGGAICQVLPICKHVATPKPAPKRTEAPRRTTPKRRPTPKATRRPPPPTRAPSPKPTPKRTQTPRRRTTSRRRPSPISTRRPPKMTTSPQVVSSKKPQGPKSTTSKPRDCPCRNKTTERPTTQSEATILPSKKPGDPNEQPTTPEDCGEPPKKPQGPNEPVDPTVPPKKPTSKPEDQSPKLPPTKPHGDDRDDPEDDDDDYYDPCEWYKGPRAVPKCTPVQMTQRTYTKLPSTEAPLDWIPIVPNDGELTEICAYWPKGKKVKKRTCKKSLKKIKGTLKRMAPTSAAP